MQFPELVWYTEGRGVECSGHTMKVVQCCSCRPGAHFAEPMKSFEPVRRADEMHLV